MISPSIGCVSHMGLKVLELLCHRITRLERLIYLVFNLSTYFIFQTVFKGKPGIHRQHEEKLAQYL